MVEYLFLDFGGCLDSPGIHTRVLFREAFYQAGLITEKELPEFQEAYTKADELMMRLKLAVGQPLRPFNRLNAKLIVECMKLSASSQKIQAAGDEVTTFQSICLRRSQEILQHIPVPMGLISNFTGNLEIILEEFDLKPYFHSITESFYVGASKPEEKIFHAALAKQKFSPSDCAFIGDNPKNDIEPARKLGLKTILIHEPGKKQECNATAYLSDLADLPALVQRI